MISIRPTERNDLEFVYSLFEEAMRYQQRQGYNIWKGYDKEVLQKEVEEKLHHKLLIDDKTALVFSAIYSDPFIWGERERSDAVYLHRIVVNPDFRGQKLFSYVLDWAITEAQNKNRKYVRLDTWGDNLKIIGYYQSFGFRFIDSFASGDDPRLPSPHRNLFFALLEYELPGI